MCLSSQTREFNYMLLLLRRYNCHWRTMMFIIFWDSQNMDHGHEIRAIHNCIQLKKKKKRNSKLQICGICKYKPNKSFLPYCFWAGQNLEFESPAKETCELLPCDNSKYYCLEDCITGGLLPCQRLSSKGLTNLSIKPIIKTNSTIFFSASVSESTK